MKKTKWIICFAVMAVGVGSALFIKGASADSGARSSADTKTLAEKKAELCPKVIHLEEKYKEDFWKEEDGHKFYMRLCTKEAVDELRWLLDTQRELNYSDLERAKTAKKLSHAIYGNGICYGTIVNSLKAAQEYSKDAVMLDPKIDDCLTLSLAGIKHKEQKGHSTCAGGVCKPKSPKE